MYFTMDEIIKPNKKYDGKKKQKNSRVDANYCSRMNSNRLGSNLIWQ